LTVPFEVVLDLHEEAQSTPAERRDNVPAIDRSWRQGFTAPTIARYVQINARRLPIAVGYPPKALQTRRTKPPATSAPPAEPDEGHGDYLGGQMLDLDKLTPQQRATQLGKPEGDLGIALSEELNRINSQLIPAS
jgi:hypothetical protein